MYQTLRYLWHQSFKLHNLVHVQSLYKIPKVLEDMQAIPKRFDYRAGKYSSSRPCASFLRHRSENQLQEGCNDLFLQNKSFCILRTSPSRQTSFNPKGLMFET